jgi:hypothetical protein
VRQRDSIRTEDLIDGAQAGDGVELALRIFEP